MRYVSSSVLTTWSEYIDQIQFIDRADNTYYNLAGISMISAIFGDSNVQMNMPLTSFANYWDKILSLNGSFKTEMNQHAEDCQYTSYIDTYLQFPPLQIAFPRLDYPDTYSHCDFLLPIHDAAAAVNPCFSWYAVNQQCPTLWSVLGPADGSQYVPPGQKDYFDRPDVQAAIHVDVGTNWTECSPYVFRDPGTGELNPGDGYSMPPALNGILQKVIEYTNNTIFGSGNLDMLIPTNGSLLALQNLTWNGLQGFQQYPGREFFVPYHREYNQGAMAGAGVVGKWGVERGVTFYQVQLAGHELPR